MQEVKSVKPFPEYVASFLINDMDRACKQRGLTVSNCGIDPGQIGLLLQWNYDGVIDRRAAREWLEDMLDQAEEKKKRVHDFIEYVCNFMSANLT